MFSLMAGNTDRGARLSRRDLVRLGAMGAMGLSLPDLLHAEQQPGGRSHGSGKAKHCIYIFLCGGPSQLEMWDPKPQAPEEIRGPFQPISTKVPGVGIGELLPQIAAHTDKLAIIRSMSHDSAVHDIGIHRTLLASKSVTNKSFPPEPSDHPAIGAMLHKLLGMSGSLPPWVVLPRHFTTGDRFYKGQTAGFLGPAFDPFALDEPKTDSLARHEFDVHMLNVGSKGADPRRLADRWQLLDQLEQSSGFLARFDPTRDMQQHYERAFSMLSSHGAKQAFDVTREPLKLRERYGLNEYGQSFLLARRLVESGVRMVNVFWTYYGPDGCQFNLWDNHGSETTTVCGGASNGIDMLTHDYCCPSFDRAFSALLEDLAARGLLDETLIVVVGEFGRTPQMNHMGGRDHWGTCYSAVLAGGGVRGGQVYGASDKHAATVVDSPVSPYDLHATVLYAFGVSPSSTIHDRSGRPIPVTDGSPVTRLF